MPRRPYLSFTSGREYACLSVAITCVLAAAYYFAVPHRSPKQAADGVGSRASAPALDPSAAARARQAYGELPLQFEANRGQTDVSVKFLARGDGYNLFLTPNEAVLDLHRRAAGERRGAARERAVLRMKLVGANPAPTVEGEQPLEARSNYFVGGDSSRSPVRAETYARVRYAGVYDGVDALYYGNQGRLEYDFVVRPHADPSQIVLAFEGAEGVELDGAGELVLRTALGEVRQHRPVIYQETAGGRREVEGRYSVRESAGAARPAHRSYSVGFELGDYDPRLPLVIDPVLVYSTYLGGGGSADTARGVAVDAAGNAYVTGETISTDFPTTAGAVQTTFGGFNYDAYVTKLNPAGTAIVFSTYLGGGDADQGYDIAVDADGNAYVAGRTISTDFPITPGALQPAFGGGSYPGGLGGDAFVAKLNPAGTALVYSTYLGGASTEYGYGVALDAARNAYVTGSTSSDNFPLVNPLQPVRRGGNDAFVAKLNAAGTALVYSTYFGGATTVDSLSASGLDNAFDIAVDAGGGAHIVGETQTTDFPVTPNAFQRSFGGLGAYEGDAYVAKFNPAGDALVYSTYLGGSYGDSGKGIALDPAGHAYVTGQTASVNFPLANAYQGALANAEAIHDAFVTKLSLDGSALVYSTYLGGSVSDSARAIAVDAVGSAYVTGGTNSSFFPVRNAVQGTLSGSSVDAFVTKLAPQGSALVYSTYLGGSRNENGYAVAVDGAGDAYVVGSTTSLGFPVTAGVVQGARNGQGDAFVSKIHVGDDEVTYRISGRVTGGDGSPLAGVEINIFGGARARTQTSADGTYSFEGLRAGADYSLTAYSPCGAFTTQNDTVNNIASDQTVDFTGGVTTFSVSGRVTISNKPDEGFGGVTMKLAGPQGTLTTRTNGLGYYSFPSVAGCRDYALTASANNISFDPPSRTYPYLSMDQSSADFTGTMHPAPVVTVTSPAQAVYDMPATVRVAADAQAGPGRTITKVEFYLGDGMGMNLKPIHTDTTAPYGGFDLTNQAEGRYSLYAYAYDDAVGVGFSEPLFYSVADASGAGHNTVWVEDAIPAGAKSGGDGEAWTWVGSSPAPYSGAASHQSAAAAGLHQHYFYAATQQLQVGAGDTLYAYVYLDPVNPPTEVMLQWNDGTWDHRAYWGANQINWGTDGTASRRHMGALPAAGQWVRLEVPAYHIGLEGRSVSGMAFTLSGGRAFWDRAGKVAAAPPPTNVIWVEDAVPAGARTGGDAEGWTWITSGLTPYSGSASHVSRVAAGMHQHYFYGATQQLQVGAGETLYAYVYLDPANMPTELMLQWNDGSWEHRAYWGSNQINWGTDGTNSRRYMGPLPAAGQWVRLEVPASQVGLEGRTLNGMAFTLYGGRAVWDKAGK